MSAFLFRDAGYWQALLQHILMGFDRRHVLDDSSDL
jgi:hypothetical protein